MVNAREALLEYLRLGYSVSPEDAAELIDQVERETGDQLNASTGCPDCGVHATCGQIVAERDQLKAALASLDTSDEQALLTSFLEAHSQALFALGNVGSLADAIRQLRNDRDRLQGIADSWQSTAGDLLDKYQELLADRDRLRLLAVHALGYSADFLGMILCTVKSLEGWDAFGPEFADKIEELADEVSPVTDHEQWTINATRDSLASARRILQGATRRE